MPLGMGVLLSVVCTSGDFCVGAAHGRVYTYDPLAGKLGFLFS